MQPFFIIYDIISRVGERGYAAYRKERHKNIHTLSADEYRIPDRHDDAERHFGTGRFRTAV